MACVVEHARLAAPAHTGHQIGHHGAQARPWHNAARIDAREAAVHPVNQRANAVGANVFVETVELCRARNAKAIFAQAAGDQLGFIVEQADMRRTAAAVLIEQIDGDGIAFDGIDVDAIAQLAGQRAAGGAGADDHGIKASRHAFLLMAHRHAGLFAIAADGQNFLSVQALHSQAFASGSQAAGELMDVAGGVAFGEVAAIEFARQRRLNGVHFLWRHGAALQPALGQ